MLFALMLLAYGVSNPSPYNVVTGGCTVPATMPHFTNPLGPSNAAVLSDPDLKGRPAMIMFFSPSQPASWHALRIAQAMYDKYGHSGLAVVGFEIDGAPTYTKPVLRDPATVQHRFHVGFPIARDCCGAQTLFCVTSVPSWYFVDRSRRMTKAAARTLTKKSIERALDRIIK